MTTFESDLERRLDDLAQAADPAGEGRVLHRVKRTDRNRQWGKIAAFVTAIAFAGGVALSLNTSGVTGEPGQANEAAQRTGAPRMAPNIDGIRGVDPGEPCSMAKHAKTVEDLQTTTPVWTPAGATLTDAWTCGGTPVLMYGQIQITYDEDPRVWGTIDVKAKWDRFVRDRGGRVETILGRPAYVHSDDEPPPADPPGGGHWVRDPSRPGLNAVMVAVDGTLISVVAKDDVPLDKLIEFTDSIQLPPELARDSK
jgi:hypothetical protein